MARMIRPSFECLETRECLSITTSLTDGGHTLVIQGTADAETVRITQDDAANTFTVESSVTRAGVVTGPVNTQTFSSSAITKVVINTAGGDDSLVYQLKAGTNLVYAKDFWVDTGSGDDSITVDLANGDAGSPNLSHIKAPLNFYSTTDQGADNVQIKLGEIEANVQVIFNTDLGVGDDVYSFSQVGSVDWRASLSSWVDGGDGRDNLSASILGNVAQQATVDVMFRGGIGNDTIAANLCGTMNGLLYFRTFGGKGADSISIDGTCGSNSTGTLCMKTYGEAGNDLISETTLALTSVTMFDCIVSGGTGTNVISTIQI
jgi:hypothetical protein